MQSMTAFLFCYIYFMKTYRYKVVKTQTEIKEGKLNLFGQRGWELCGTHQDEWGYIYYFKKEDE